MTPLVPAAFVYIIYYLFVKGFQFLHAKGRKMWCQLQNDTSLPLYVKLSRSSVTLTFDRWPPNSIQLWNRRKWWEFHQNLYITFWGILLTTNKNTKKCWQNINTFMAVIISPVVVVVVSVVLFYPSKFQAVKYSPFSPCSPPPITLTINTRESKLLFVILLP